jgi:MSHA pilin protein MshA
MPSSKRQSGFTLIELVIVIVILGILAVTAAPRFIDISSDAKRASRSAMVAAIRTAVTLAYSKCMVSYSCNGATYGSITLGGDTIVMINNYPAGKDGIALLVNAEVQGWEISADNLGALFAYPGTTWAGGDSDCTIYYRYHVNQTSPPYIDPLSGYNRDTCSK